MRVRLLWKRRRSPDIAATRRNQLRKAILTAAGLNETSSVRTEEVLQRFAIRDLESFLQEVSSTKHIPRALRHPGCAPERTAVLDPRILPTDGIRVYSGWRDPALAAWRPESLAAPLEILLAITRLPGPAADLRHSVIAFTGLVDSVLTDADFGLLWRTFQVPVFEQLRAPDGRLLATECEAHAGLHIEQHAACFELLNQGAELIVSYVDGAARPALRIATGLTAQLDTSACACGASAPRLVRLRKRAAKRLDQCAVGAA